MLALETRMNDEIGQRVADIDAHVGRISAGLDDAVLTLNDRIAAADRKFTDIEAEFTQIREELAAVDADAIDEIKEKISSALGQAELVRIEMERFQETVKESLEATNVRLTEVETTVQDQSMDVETAVQLERLEEIERAVLMLDPDAIGTRTEDATIAMQRPVDTEAAAPGDNTTPIVPMAARLGPPANTPLAPPTADPATGSGTSAEAAADDAEPDDASGGLSLTMSLEPPAGS